MYKKIGLDGLVIIKKLLVELFCILYEMLQIGFVFEPKLNAQNKFDRGLY
jgi:hypothetical protein